MKKQTRREFLEFLGYSSVALTAISTTGCVKNTLGTKSLQPLQPGISTDTLLLSPGFEYSVIAKWGDYINSNEQFGTHNDYLAFFADDPANPTSGMLWVNHEYLQPNFFPGYSATARKKKDQVDAEQLTVGGSVIRIQKNAKGKWELVQDDRNFRLTGATKIPLTKSVYGSNVAMGTFANCAGGVTPWGTVLTCEENFQDFYGNREFEKTTINLTEYDYQWGLHYKNPPEHYGWVVEVDIKNKTAKKLVSLGRFSHECATTVVAKDGRCVVYTGDDQNNEYIYKFISNSKNSLEEGTLYVADTVNGKWLPLDVEKDARLKNKFSNQTNVLVWARDAAKLIGATPQDRPEDIEINPHTGEVMIALTNNVKKNNFFGSILKLKEKNNDYLSMEFTTSTFLTGGETTGFACPDNMAYDPAGNFWFTCDVSGSKMHKPPYTKFGNNGLFVVPHSGKFEGMPIQVGSAPMDAELTGPYFAPDGKTLFISVQHPGEETKSTENYTSHWPMGGSEMPRSAVVAIQGPMLEALSAKKS